MEAQVLKKHDLALKSEISRLMKVPSFCSATVFSTSGPTQSLRNTTLRSRSFSNSSATGFKEYFSEGLPSGRPRWDIKVIVLASWSMQYLMVGNAATIR